MKFPVCLKKIPALLFVAGMAMLPLRAEAILFIGNSFTFGGHVPQVKDHGGVPLLVEAIARSKGKDISTAMLTASGKDWGFHLAQPATDLALKSQPWDCVVLQDYSTKPTRLGDLAGFLRNGQAFYNLIGLDAPKARIVLFETWARGQGHPFYKTGVTSAKTFGNPGDMYADLHAGYAQLQATLQAENPARSVEVAPVGTAFDRCIRKYPAINLYDGDRYHANSMGSYLAALVLYATIFHDSPLGATEQLPGYALSKQDAADLQAVAQEVTAR